MRNFFTLTDGIDYGEPLIACIGPVTAATARKLGFEKGIDYPVIYARLNG